SGPRRALPVGGARHPRRWLEPRPPPGRAGRGRAAGHRRARRPPRAPAVVGPPTRPPLPPCPPPCTPVALAWALQLSCRERGEAVRRKGAPTVRAGSLVPDVRFTLLQGRRTPGQRGRGYLGPGRHLGTLRTRHKERAQRPGVGYGQPSGRRR